jgi:hypothetical protein
MKIMYPSVNNITASINGIYGNGSMGMSNNGYNGNNAANNQNNM